MTNKYNIYMPFAYHEKAVQKAKEKGMTFSMYIRYALNELWEEEKQEIKILEKTNLQPLTNCELIKLIGEPLYFMGDIFDEEYEDYNHYEEYIQIKNISDENIKFVFFGGERPNKIRFLENGMKWCIYERRPQNYPQLSKWRKGK